MAALSLLLAAAAAGCNAFSSVTQRKANRRERAEERTGMRLLIELIEQPAWWLGIVAMSASFLLQATALSQGTLAAVEPVLVIELPLTVILSSWMLHRPLHTRDWVTTAVMAVGLALFIAVLAPQGGDATGVSVIESVLASGATVAAIAVTAVIAQYGPDRSRTALFGAAAGAGFGLTASLMKIAVTTLASRGLLPMLDRWESYATIVAGIGSVLLMQAALHSGTLVAAQPGITLGDPVVSVVWGTLVLRESVRTGPILAVAVAGAAMVAGAVFALSGLSDHPDVNNPDAGQAPDNKRATSDARQR